MYFRFAEDIIFSHNQHYGASCVILGGDSVAAETSASIPTKFCSTRLRLHWVAHRGRSVLLTTCLVISTGSVTLLVLFALVNSIRVSKAVLGTNQASTLKRSIQYPSGKPARCESDRKCENFFRLGCDRRFATEIQTHRTTVSMSQVHTTHSHTTFTPLRRVAQRNTTHSAAPQRIKCRHALFCLRCVALRRVVFRCERGFSLSEI